MDVCPVCGEKAVKEDSENGQTVRVCIECGSLDSDMLELTSKDQFQGTTITDGRGHGPEGRKGWIKDGSSSIEKNKMLGTKLITSIGNQLHVGENTVSEACHLYERVYETDLYYAHQDNKKAMCLACLYAAARINRVPVNIRVLGFFLNINDSAKRFATALKGLKGKHDVHLPALNIESETWGVLSQSDLSNEVVKITQQLMLIMQRALITTGRHCMSIVVPCSYYAFKASDIFQNKKLSFKAFCRKFGFKLSLRYRCRTEIENTLKAMAKELPWVKGSGVDTDHVEIYIKDIIKYQSSLLAQAIQTAVQQMDEADEDNDKAGLDISREPGSIFRKFPKRDLEKENNVNEDCGTSVKKKAKYEKREKASDSASAGNSSGLESLDLGSDDDTDLYILSLQEVMQKREVQMKYEVHFEEEKSDDSKQVVDKKPQSRKLSSAKGVDGKVKLASNTGHDGEDTDDEADCDDEENELTKYLLKRQSDGTADDGQYSDEEYYD